MLREEMKGEAERNPAEQRDQQMIKGLSNKAALQLTSSLKPARLPAASRHMFYPHKELHLQ